MLGIEKTSACSIRSAGRGRRGDVGPRQAAAVGFVPLRDDPDLAPRLADQGREVFVVPGSILSTTGAGGLRLLRDGARPITSAEDVLEFLAAGASVVQIGTALFDDPQAAERIRTGLDAALAATGVAEAGDIVGRAHGRESPPAKASTCTGGLAARGSAPKSLQIGGNR